MVSGWTLLGVGMITVFVVLLSVVLIARLLIKITNQFEISDVIDSNSDSNIPSEIKAILEKVVHKETNGIGSIQKIERIN